MRTLGLILSISLYCLGPSLEGASKKHLSLDRYLEWEDVTDPQLSPDARQVVYGRRWVDEMNDRWKTTLWVMKTNGEKNRFLVDGSSARWSPAGDRIAFLAPDEESRTQIFVRWMDTEGAVSQVTRIRETPSNIAWSPDGKLIAFQKVVPPTDDGRWNIDMPGRPEGAKWAASPTIIERLNYRRDRVGYSPRGYRHVFIVPADGDQPRQVTSGDFHHDAFRWMPDGQSIVFHSLRVDDAEYQWRESEIYSINLASGEVKQITNRRGPDVGPLPSPDGRYIAYTGYDWTTDTYREEVVYVMGVDGSNRKIVAEEVGRRPANMMWAEDGSGIYFTAQMRGTSNLYFAAVSGEGVRNVTNGNHMLNVTNISNGTAVGTLTSYQIPRNLVTFSVSNSEDVKTLHVTNRGHLAEVTLGKVDEIWYQSKDGLDIQGWIVQPPEFDPTQKYPLILRIHGGPHSMFNVGFDFKNQDHAANGYVVLYTNPRGSSGYGSEFGNEINNAYPDKDFDDLMAGVDEVISRGYIDKRNLFVYGGSGGGVLTAWIVGHTDRFTAAVSKAPVINWLSFVGTTDGASWYRNFAKLPWDDPSEHLRRSPLMYVGNVSTPTMLMTGEKDLRTPMEQTEQYYKALKLRKIPTAMVRLTGSWHSRSLPPTNLLRVQLYLRNWFERFMVE